MSSKIIHYFFGELEKINTSKVFPEDAHEIQHYLDSWLPDIIQHVSDVIPDISTRREECNRWAHNDITAEVGFISIPLPSNIHYKKSSYHLVCRVYFSWASAGRESLSGHALLLPSNIWENIEHNPFALPHFIKRSSDFEDLKEIRQKLNVFDTSLEHLNVSSWERGQFIFNEHHDEVPGALSSELILPNKQWFFELIILCLPFSVRKEIAYWTSPIGIKSEYQQYFLVGRNSRQTQEVHIDQQIFSLDTFHNLFRMLASPNNRVIYEQIACKVTSHLEIPEFPITINRSAKESSSIAERPRKKKTFGILRKFSLWGTFIKWIKPYPKLFGSVAVILIIVTAIYVAIPSREQKIEQWLEKFEQSHNERPFELIYDLDNTLEDDPNPKSYFDKVQEPLRSLLRNVRGKVEETTSYTQVEDVHEFVLLVHQFKELQAIPIKHSFIDQLIMRLYENEKRVIELYQEDQVDIRRKQLNTLVALYAKEQNIPKNIYLQELEQSTFMLEARKSLRLLERKWEEIAVIEQKNLIRFQEEIDNFRKAYPDLWNADLIKVETSIHKKYEHEMRQEFKKNYEIFQQKFSERQLKKLYEAANVYQDSLLQIPNHLKSQIDVIMPLAIVDSLTNTEIVSIQTEPNRNVIIGIYDESKEKSIKDSLIDSINPFAEENLSPVKRKTRFRLLGDENLEIIVQWKQGYSKTYEKIFRLSTLLSKHSIKIDNNLSLKVAFAWPEIK